MWSGKKVLVTGAGGFIGSHLTEALVAAGATTTAMVRYNSGSLIGNLAFGDDHLRKEIRVVSGTIEDSDFVYRVVEGQDVVFHLAALIAIPYSYEAPRTYLRTNVEGTLNVLEAARRYGGTRVVHTSTSEVYGTALRTPIDESHPLQGQSPYSASKIGADKLAESYYRSFGTPVVTVRPFNTFGPRQSARAFIPTIISQALKRDEVRTRLAHPRAGYDFRRRHSCRLPSGRVNAWRRGRYDQPRNWQNLSGGLVREANSWAHGSGPAYRARRRAVAPCVERGHEARLGQFSRPGRYRLVAHGVDR